MKTKAVQIKAVHHLTLQPHIIQYVLYTASTQELLSLSDLIDDVLGNNVKDEIFPKRKASAKRFKR